MFRVCHLKQEHSYLFDYQCLIEYGANVQQAVILIGLIRISVIQFITMFPIAQLPRWAVTFGLIQK
jgi:hypothetical protein